ncbi:sulfotransferase domain-containing protein [Candidatus Woesearchaeota archaeon]|nr:sulfotransferase domain-containing protein [Candidatus Woesearchaeota archaeon]
MKNKEINYVVIGTPRSGSTLFFNLLKINNLATKKPSQEHYEAFHEMFDNEEFLKGYKLEEYINKKLEENSFYYDNFKIRGIKILIPHIPRFLNNFNLINGTNYTINEFYSSFPKNTKFIYISRRNKLEQAISDYKANKNDIWKIEKNTGVRDKFVCFNYSEIEKHLIKVINNKKKNKLIIKELPNYLTIVYEDFSKNFKSTIKTTSNYLGIKLNKINSNVELKKQRNINNKYLYLKFIFYRNLFRISYILKKKSTLYRKLIKMSKE